MLTLGFTDQEILNMFGQEWEPEEKRAFVADVAKRGGVERVYQLYVQAGGTPDRVEYIMFVADGARKLGMLAETRAIIKQASSKDLDEMSTFMNWELRPIVLEIQRDRSRHRAIAVGVTAGVLGAFAITLLVWAPWKDESFLWPEARY
jgi:hypothetical protein